MVRILYSVYDLQNVAVDGEVMAPMALEHPLIEPRSRDSIGMHVTGSLSRLRRSTGIDLAFCGRVDPGSGLRLQHFDGLVVGPLREALLDVGHGLGGRVLVQKRPVALEDYLGTPSILHTYDDIIQAERLRAMVAAPVIVGRDQIAVLYAAARKPQAALGRLLDAVMHEARSLEQTVAVADVLRHRWDDEPVSDPEEWRTRVRTAATNLRSEAGTVADAGLRGRLMEIVDELAADGPEADPAGVALTGREQDVLALISNGLTNRAIAEKLGIGVYTVKDHVKNLMGKLTAASRFEVMVKARRRGLLR